MLRYGEKKLTKEKFYVAKKKKKSSRKFGMLMLII